MENFRLLFNIYIRPVSAFSDIMDNGSWLFAAVAVAIIAFSVQYGVNNRIASEYSVGILDQIVNGQIDDTDYEEAEPDREFLPQTAKKPFPLVGSRVQFLFRFDSSFLSPLITLVVFFVPGVILLAAMIGRLGNAGVVIGREYGTFSTCVLMAWAAAHLPFGIASWLFIASGPAALSLWAVSGLVFAVFLLFAVRTVFGVGYGEAAIVVLLCWIPYSIGVNVLRFVSPWFFSPFLLIYGLMIFGGYMRGGVTGISDSMRRKRDFKRHLQSATVNPNDADAHVQLGLIYSSRLQNERAKEHFLKAFEIDDEEIDANFELGVIARKEGELQKAIEHFATVVGQNDTFRLSEIWREIGITYLEAGMAEEAREALEKYVSRRPFDGEGLYYFGKLLKDSGDDTGAREMFERAVEAAATAPYHRRRELRKWAKLAKREM